MRSIYIYIYIVFLFMFPILSRRCPLLATFLSILLCLLSMLISDSRFDLVWFRLSCDHGWIRSGLVNVRKTTNNNNTQNSKYIGNTVKQIQIEKIYEAGRPRGTS